MAALRSLWGSLNENLIGKIYPIEHQYGESGDWWQRVDGSDSVEGPITDATLETALQWRSPFEAVGAEQKLPLLSGLLQSGGLQSALSALASFVPADLAQDAQNLLGPQSDLSRQSLSNQLKQFEGVTGITRLNSTQIFSGMQPLDFTMTMIFRAWQDPVSEVQEPVNQLMQWALPQELSKQGFLQSLTSGASLIRSLFPSKAPQILGFDYAGMSILPVVVEAIGNPITVPRDADGNRLHVAIPLKISTLAAIDAAGWKQYKVR